MALVTDYASLQAHLVDTLVRSDLTSQVQNFIQQFEASARRGITTEVGVIPIRRLSDRGTVTISADGLSLPSDFYELEAWYHDGPTYYGPITIVDHDQLGGLKQKLGATGVPQYAAIVEGKVQFAPVPDQVYNTRKIYWRKVVSLSTGTTSNWLLQDHPDIYIYGSLLESAPFLKHDARVPMWRTELNTRVIALHEAGQSARFGGTLRRKFTPIG